MSERKQSRKALPKALEAHKFKPGGRTPNPYGRPKIPQHVKDAARAYTLEAIETLADVMRNGDTSTARVTAANALLNRAWGAPAGSMDGATVNIDARQVNMSIEAGDLVNRALAMLGGPPLLEGTVIEAGPGVDDTLQDNKTATDLENG